MAPKFFNLFSKKKTPPATPQASPPAIPGAPLPKPGGLPVGGVSVSTGGGGGIPPVLKPPPKIQPVALPEGMPAAKPPFVPGTGKKRITQRISVPGASGANSITAPTPAQRMEFPKSPVVTTTQKLDATNMGKVDVPFSVIIASLPEGALAGDVESLTQSLGSKNVELPLGSIIPMLPSGKVEFAMKDLIPRLPQEALAAEAHLSDMMQVIVPLPLAEVVMRVPPQYLALRSDQKSIDPLVTRMADPFSEEALKRAAAERAAAAAAQQKEEQAAAEEEQPLEEESKEEVPSPEAIQEPVEEEDTLRHGEELPKTQPLSAVPPLPGSKFESVTPEEVVSDSTIPPIPQEILPEDAKTVAFRPIPPKPQWPIPKFEEEAQSEQSEESALPPDAPDDDELRRLALAAEGGEEEEVSDTEPAQDEGQEEAEDFEETSEDSDLAALAALAEAAEDEPVEEEGSGDKAEEEDFAGEEAAVPEEAEVSPVSQEEVSEPPSAISALRPPKPFEPSSFASGPEDTPLKKDTEEAEASSEIPLFDEPAISEPSEESEPITTIPPVAPFDLKREPEAEDTVEEEAESEETIPPVSPFDLKPEPETEDKVEEEAVSEPQPPSPVSDPFSAFKADVLKQKDISEEEKPEEPETSQESPVSKDEEAQALEVPAVSLPDFSKEEEEEKEEISEPEPVSEKLSQDYPDLNTCGLEDLVAVPGCNEALAKKILAWRELHDSFSSSSQLMRVPGMTSTVYRGLTGELPPQLRIPSSINRLIGVDSAREIAMKDITAHLRKWPGVLGCVIGGKDGLPVVYDHPDKGEVTALCALASKLFAVVNELMQDFGISKTSELHVPTDEVSYFIFWRGDLFVLVANEKKELPGLYSEIIRLLLKELADSNQSLSKQV